MGISRENPNILEIMGLLKNNVASNINCHNIGRIIEFDAQTQTCSVEILQIKQYLDNYYTPAPITDVPLIIYGAGGGHITLPNPVGTYCLLFFMDRNIDSFLETGEQYVPETSRMHDFTDCIAITTFKTLVNPISDYDENAISILHEGIINEIQYKSSVKIYPNKIQMNVTQANEDDPQQAEITLDDKILIKNNSGDLMSLVSALITAVKNIATVPDESGGTLTANSIQALTNVENQFKALLKENTEDV
jgi:hypothetical protein